MRQQGQGQCQTASAPPEQQASALQALPAQVSSVRCTSSYCMYAAAAAVGSVENDLRHRVARDSGDLQEASLSHQLAPVHAPLLHALSDSRRLGQWDTCDSGDQDRSTGAPWEAMRTVVRAEVCLARQVQTALLTRLKPAQ